MWPVESFSYYVGDGRERAGNKTVRRLDATIN
jgi:hypothetical protein